MDMNQNDVPESGATHEPRNPIRSIARRVAHTRHIGKLAAVVTLAALLAAGYTFGASPSDSQHTSADSQRLSAGSNKGSIDAPGLVPMPAASAAAAAPVTDGGIGYNQSSGVDASTTTNLAALPQSVIIKTGSLSLEVGDLDKAIASAQSTIAAAGGSVASSNRDGNDAYATATLTFRIPAAKWDDALAALRKVGTKVLSEQTGTNDVTMQVVDLNARLDNLQKTETAFQAILARASSVPDVLAIQQQLSQTQGQIEELTAQRDQLNNQAAMSTLTVSLTLPGPTVTTQATQDWTLSKQVDEAAAALVRIGQGIATMAVWAVVVVIPVAIGLLVLFVLYLLGRRISRRGSKPEAAAS